MDPRAILLLTWIATALAAEESCVGRCENGFDSKKKCQCDSMCTFYGSCCYDYDSTCHQKITRGDTFHHTGDHVTAPNVTTVAPNTTIAPRTTPTTPAPTTSPPKPSDPDADPCSGHAFNSFMQLKNGSIYAFRGDFVFELNEQAVVQGYPKLIKDVWGISGPIDAAFTRINCQGKTYLFKGNRYWRFDDGVLDDDYPREISVGFEKIPDSVDAAFALPSTNHHGKEKVYFFKGDRYYLYEFKHQPSHEECVEMSKASPSVLFTQYTDVYCDQWTDLFDLLFQGGQGLSHSPHFISKDWAGIKPPVDAVMAGRLYVTPPAPPPTAPGPGRDDKKRRKGPSTRGRGRGGRGRGGRGQRRRQSRSPWDFFDLWDDDYEYDHAYETVELGDREAEAKSQPVQNVYFFKRDKYYRVDLQTKRVDYANPPYPRSIAKYWLGCSRETSLAEK